MGRGRIGPTVAALILTAQLLVVTTTSRAAAAPASPAAPAAPTPSCATYDGAAVLGWWKGEGNLVAEIGPDLAGSTGFTSGEVGRGFNLLTSNALSIDGFPQVETGVTVEAWIRPVQTQSGQVVMSRWQFLGADGTSSYVFSR